MDAAALARAIEEDRAAGHLPFCVVATVGTTSTSSIDPVPAIADAVRARTALAARRCRLRRLGCGRPRAAPHPRRLRARGLARRSTRTSGSSRPSTSPRSTRGGWTCCAAPSRSCPNTCARSTTGRGRAQRLRLRHPARPPLPRPQALDGPPLLRPRRARRAHPRALPPRAPVRLVGRSRRPAGNCSRPSP